MLLAFQWPSPVSVVTATFLQGSEGGPSPGMRFVAATSEVNSPAPGEILFLDVSPLQPRLQWASWPMVVLQHEDGHRSLLLGVRPRETLRFKTRVGPMERLGEVDRDALGILWCLMDREGKFLNPATFLADASQAIPRIMDITLSDGAQEFSLYQRSVVPVGFYTVRLTVLEQQRRGTQVLQRILRSWSLLHNAVERREWVLSRAEWGRDGPKATESRIPLEDLVRNDRIYELGRVFIGVGLNSLEVEAVSYDGGRASQVFRVLGRRP